MEIVIDTDTIVKDVQSAFNIVYPYLKIEFYKKHHTESDQFLKFEKLNPSQKFNRFTKAGNKVHIDIDAKKTVTQLENDFLEFTGTWAQIFRRSGNMWIETSLTDDWTLERQNKAGELFSAVPQKKSQQENLEDQRFDEE